MRRGVKRSLAALAALVFLGTLLELGLRVARPFHFDPPLYPGDRTVDGSTPPNTVLDAELGWLGAPGAVIVDDSPEFRVTYTCNASGFRAHAHAARATTKRALALGDSFTFGVGVEDGETFCERLEELCDGLTVENLGVPGYGVDQMLCALRRFGAELAPQLVIVTFVDDDLARSMTSYRYRNSWSRKPAFALVDGVLVPRDASNSPGPLSRWISQHSHIAALARRAQDSLGLRKGFGERFELNLALLRAIGDECRKLGARLLVVHLPERGAWQPRASFAAPLAESGAAYFDLGALEVADPRALYYKIDPHLHAAGHRYVAERIAERLRADPP